MTDASETCLPGSCPGDKSEMTALRAPKKPAAGRPSKAGAAHAEAVVLSVSASSARARLLDGGEEMTFRSADVRATVPGHVVSLAIEKRATRRGEAHASGKVLDTRVDVARLGLAPLPLEGGGALGVDGEDADDDDATDRYAAAFWKELRSKPRPAYEFVRHRLGRSLNRAGFPGGSEC